MNIKKRTKYGEVHDGRSPSSLGLSQHNYKMFQSHLTPSLTISFVKKESFKPNLKSGKGVYFPDIYWQLIPQERGLITEGSAVWERSALLGKYSTMRSLRYDGARSLRALYVRRILNPFLNLTGSQ